ncbi:MAG: hypothetical protein SGCHY_003544 [Lobulomycetales sp.]
MRRRNPNEATNELSEQDQMEIIKTSGVLKKIQQAQKEGSSSGKDEEAPDHLFIAVMYTIPLSCFYICMDVLLYRQYGMPVNHAYTRYPAFCIALFLVIYYTNRVVSNRWVQIAMALASIWAGVNLIQITTSGRSTFGPMKQAPGIATLWVYCVLQLRLDLAVLGLLPVIGFYYWEPIRDMFIGSRGLS